jgi:tRNA nucleotidyltransferase (CCA-adding enzyme)
MEIRINMPDDVKNIIAELNRKGYEAYAVGGCVRDSIMCREPKDWDITTSAQPNQVMELFPHVIETGARHGTVTVMYNKAGYEVTTFRLDG